MNLLLEIGCEELPSSAIDLATEFLPKQLESELKRLRLSCGTIESFGTPRRLLLLAQNLNAAQEDLNTEILGPKINIAFDQQNQLTPAGLGFLKARHLKPEHAYQKNGVLAAKLHQKGRSSLEILSELLPQIISQIPFHKTMRWESSKTRFARPIRWLLCLLDKQLVPFEIAGVKSSDKTCGHRLLSPGFKRVTQKTYFDFLAKNYVMYDGKKRQALISKHTPTQDPQLLKLVANLVEYPWPVIGKFDKDYLKIPQEILICEMREHQKYFPILDKNQKLKSEFVIVAGTKTKGHSGYERVLKARFEDGAFYYQEDLKKKLSDFVTEPPIPIPPSFQSSQLLDRAAYLCKADLNTGIVGQFPELQGIMGAIYAQKDGEAPEVVQAIREHYCPRFSADKTPQTQLGAILALSDRLAILRARKLPKGSADPYGLRRAAIGIARIILDHGFQINLNDLISNPETVEFVMARARGVFLEKHPILVVDATQSAAAYNLCAWQSRILALQNFDYAAVSAVFKRVSRISPPFVKGGSGGILQEPSELSLAQAVHKIQITDNYPLLLEQLGALKPILDQFFEDVMVMTEDLELRQARLDLLLEVQKKAAHIADFSKLTV